METSIFIKHHTTAQVNYRDGYNLCSNTNTYIPRVFLYTYNQTPCSSVEKRTSIAVFGKNGTPQQVINPFLQS